MKKAFSYLIGFGVLVFLYVSLKQLGVIGRQFYTGTNTQVRFEVKHIGQVFELPLNKNRRGIYRYKSRLVYGELDFAPDAISQSASFTFNERFCKNNNLIGYSHLRIETDAGSSRYDGHGRYGALAKTPLLQKQQKICLEIIVNKLSEPIFENLKLDIWVGDTRPCWGIECMLD